MPLFIVETKSSFRHRYVVDAESEAAALEEVEARLDDLSFKEFSQLHLGETPTSVKHIEQDEYLRLFREDHEYLTNLSEERMLSFINCIESEDV